MIRTATVVMQIGTKTPLSFFCNDLAIPILHASDWNAFVDVTMLWTALEGVVFLKRHALSEQSSSMYILF